MKKKEEVGTGYQIRCGYVTPFVVHDLAERRVVAAFDRLSEAIKHCPTAEVDAGAWRKAKELGQG